MMSEFLSRFSGPTNNHFAVETAVVSVQRWCCTMVLEHFQLRVVVLVMKHFPTRF